jgi:hypothetical protein
MRHSAFCRETPVIQMKHNGSLIRIGIAIFSYAWPVRSADGYKGVKP